jgi:hypothetical protein
MTTPRRSAAPSAMKPRKKTVKTKAALPLAWRWCPKCRKQTLHLDGVCALSRKRLDH